MPKIGRFKNEASKQAYESIYRELEGTWPVPSTQLDVPTSFGTTHVRRSGTGTETPIVLLHAVGANCLQWHIVIEDLCRDRVVYALDTIGTAGRSVQTAPLTGESDFATWVGEVLNELGVDRVHLVGYSHGAWHAVLVALHAPERLASVTLIEPGGVFDKPSWRVLLKMIRAGMRRTDKNIRELNDWLSPGYVIGDREFALVTEALNYRPGVGWARMLKDAEVQSISVPMLVISGAETVVSSPEQVAARLADLVPEAEVEIYAGTGHGILGHIPDRVIPRLMKFVRNHDDAKRT
ncbi:MAG: alpha/beta fold hydrolase [Rhodococcus qingshengii]|uniref:alpha/beta fold hydrolase n=1 Tax=Rhodococcus TaxID=1827 RepID=UPI000936EBE7|nr:MULTISPECIES: alpha/beta fold hydrolase [Rhodococcus]OKA14587.1 alpha/beta hydrolase [Rhodococcus erythropolis]MBP2525330.1 pimeloyl-ACP methyl ester carboxylesterase [Rhodococcus sp. PvP104]MBW4815485.1 alpha/beta fold hydrolase [Rhodococcus qingshengii]MCZ4544092.1 alpha/beta fold hydrolase [Rhodococcus qingshengii]MCZ4614175.1 alpha/beta fold hydrolase [Rhodococcus qingshengii]